MSEEIVEKVGIEKFLGKQVIMQLKGGDPWMGVCSDEGEPAPIMINRPGAKEPALMHAPFFQGKLVEHAPPFLIVEYLDQNKSKMLQAFHESAVAGVTCVLEQAAVHIIQP